MVRRKKITEVFTPRQSEVNNDMYVKRPIYEKSLLRALSRNSHSLVFGDSGSGKSWLYKKVLNDNSIQHVIANCANASRFNSITQEICNCLIEPGTVNKLGFSEEKIAEVNAFFAKGGVKHSGNFGIAQEEPLLKAFRIFHEMDDSNKIVVLDNLESIFESTGLMNELADIIILLDDERYSTCNINFLIVGIPNGVLKYFSETKNVESVSNRIREIGRVDGLSSDQVMQIVKKGFDQLSIFIDNEKLIKLSGRIRYITLGIPQRVHEYCESLAYEIEDNDWEYNHSLLKLANAEWLKQGLRQSYNILDRHWGKRATPVERKNQVIFCIGKITSHQFDTKKIEFIIKKEFPATVPKKKMGINSILNQLSQGDSPLLNKGKNSYSIRDPRYLMCIRVATYKNLAKEKAIKRNFKS
ncbi:AAA family ATPase [Desulfobulbus sp. TB]|nr:AAA family ATPase [Desulfobulbus sp. TB]